MYFVLAQTAVVGGELFTGVYDSQKARYYQKPHVWILYAHRELFDHAFATNKILNDALKDKSKRAPLPDEPNEFYGLSILRRTAGRNPIYIHLTLVVRTKEVVEFKARDFVRVIDAGESEEQIRNACARAAPSTVQAVFHGSTEAGVTTPLTREHFSRDLQAYCV